MTVTFSKLVLYGMRYGKFEPIYRPQTIAIVVQWAQVNLTEFNKSLCAK